MSGILEKMSEIQQLADLGTEESTPELICARVAKIFRVSETEVALLELSGSMLNFLYPAELKTAGAIPRSNLTGAAPTPRGKQAEMFKGLAEGKKLSAFAFG